MNTATDRYIVLNMVHSVLVGPAASSVRSMSSCDSESNVALKSINITYKFFLSHSSEYCHNMCKINILSRQFRFKRKPELFYTSLVFTDGYLSSGHEVQ